jgi:hypothetical protein
VISCHVAAVAEANRISGLAPVLPVGASWSAGLAWSRKATGASFGWPVD